jgi:Kef-type K+ transport system membrane component KefB
VCARLRIVPIVGFLLAGVLIGPDALGIVREREIIDAAAEVGVILLLFTIGIEFSIGRLLAIRRLVLLGGSLQVAGAVALTTGVLVLAGVELRAALFTGLLVSLSSTAIVLKLLGDRGSTSSAVGRTSLGLLIFQDLAVVAMVLLLPVLGESGAGGGGPLARALLTALAVVVVTLVVARRVLPPVLEAVARACSPEVFLLSVIALCLGTAYLTALAGVSVSLGAFLAGLVVSESRHSAHALGEVLPLQILFSATFFLSIGTLLDVRFLLEEPLLVLAAVVLVLVVKVVTTGLAAWATGVGAATAVSASLLLAQVGEFAFVLERLGREQGLSPAGLGESGSQAFIAATVLLLVATPGLAAGGRSAAARLAARGAEDGPGPVGGPRRLPRRAGARLGWGGAARHLAAELVGRRHRRRRGDALAGRCCRGRGARPAGGARRLDPRGGARDGRRRAGPRGRRGRRRAGAGVAHRGVVASSRRTRSWSSWPPTVRPCRACTSPARAPWSSARGPPTPRCPGPCWGTSSRGPAGPPTVVDVDRVVDFRAARTAPARTPRSPARCCRRARAARTACARGPLGAPAAVHQLRARRLLRLLAQPARRRARHARRPPGDGLGRAGRGLGLVLPGRDHPGAPSGLIRRPALSVSPDRVSVHGQLASMAEGSHTCGTAVAGCDGAARTGRLRATRSRSMAVVPLPRRPGARAPAAALAGSELLQLAGTPAQVAAVLARMINDGWAFDGLPVTRGRGLWLVSARRPAVQEQLLLHA